MVIVTTVTAYFLYKTLQSQKEVQKTQTRLFEIESIRFKESIKPVLRYTLSTEKMMLEDKDKRMVTIEVINETERTATNITPEYGENKRAVAVVSHPNPGHLIKGDTPLFLHFIIESSEALVFIVFSLSYQDVSGTKYKQGVYCICDSQVVEINSFLPEIVN